ncbi:MAG: ATP-binding protein, partial [Betaproteobacteria bacterium]|nr:ATP-binding protein [Betaproteobacteria bacterium]
MNAGHGAQRNVETGDQSIKRIHIPRRSHCNIITLYVSRALCHNATCDSDIMTVYRARALAPLARRALREMPVVAITGLRQSGKSTFLLREKGLAGRRYRTLDDPAQLAAARADPGGFVRSDEPLAIDEAQKCPELLPEIKREVDRDRRPGRYLLSGSANFALLKGVTESLAGRALYLTLHPFTRRELRGRCSTPPLLRRAFDAASPPKRQEAPAPIGPRAILRGGFPPVCLGRARESALWFRGYEQTYLERDVRGLARIGDLAPFRTLLQLAALRTAQVLGASELGRDAKLNAATVARYLSLLEASFVIRRIAPFLANRASRLIKSPKLYIADSGLAGHLTGVDEARFEAGDPLSGALRETYVAQNLAAILDSEWPEARLA